MVSAGIAVISNGIIVVLFETISTLPSSSFDLYIPGSCFRQEPRGRQGADGTADRGPRGRRGEAEGSRDRYFTLNCKNCTTSTLLYTLIQAILINL